MENNALCPECYKVAQEEAKKAEAEAAKVRAAESGLPELTGSEKQRSWALEIRDKFMNDLNLKEKAGITNEQSIAGALFRAISKNALGQNEAHWWIENRENPLANLKPAYKYMERIGEGLLAYFKVKDLDDAVIQIIAMSPDELYNLLAAIVRGETPARGITPVTAEQIEAQAETAAARVIRPENPKTETVAVIEKNKEEVCVKMPVWDERAIHLLKKIGFEWRKRGRSWARKCNDATNDRVIEIAVHLLSWNYIVSVPELWMVDRVKNADYQPLNTRKVYARRDGTFGVTWHRSDGDWCDTAKRIRGAKWDSGEMVAPSTSFDEVLDFAERHGFDVSDKARALAEKARLVREKSLVVSVKPIKTEKLGPMGDKPEKLEIPESVSIDESLLDTD
jgi:hypothetical protein